MDTCGKAEQNELFWISFPQILKRTPGNALLKFFGGAFLELFYTKNDES